MDNQEAAIQASATRVGVTLKEPARHTALYQ